MIKNLFRTLLVLGFAWNLFTAVIYAQDEPPLPDGLNEKGTNEIEEPDLPNGIINIEEESSDEPMIPEGLDEHSDPSFEKISKEDEKASDLPFELTGYFETRGGLRTQRDPYEKDASIGEARLQLEMEKLWVQSSFKMTTDFLYDPVYDHHSIKLEEGKGWIDLRELNLFFSPLNSIDVKAGRQIMTWGTGDMLFINDLFPKDWKSFFIGRDTEYLKAPSDSIKVSVYTAPINLDIVYNPRFDADRFIDGTRISYWNNILGRRSGEDVELDIDKPDDLFDDDEISLRFFKNISGYELALYGYWGFWKSPGGLDPATYAATFPKLSVYGSSVRGSVIDGIGNIEIGYYDTMDDRDGTDPFMRNSEFRILLGYEQGLKREFTVGIQYYIEYMMKYNNYESNLPPGIIKADKDRHLITLRLTKLMLNQNFTMSLFSYYSPSDNDAYFRPKVHYKIDDNWNFETGGNVFYGKDDHTFFGQFEKNSNVYIGLRYSF